MNNIEVTIYGAVLIIFLGSLGVFALCVIKKKKLTKKGNLTIRTIIITTDLPVKFARQILKRTLASQ